MQPQPALQRRLFITSSPPPRARGVTLHKPTGMWRAAITVNGARMELGAFADAVSASDAYEAARAVYRDQQYAAQRKRRKGGEAASSATLPPQPGEGDGAAAPVVTRSRFMGVQREVGHERWEAVLLVDGQERHGGEYDTEEDAARAHDALARMYLGRDAATNFPVNPYEAWVPDADVGGTGQIETRVGEPLTVEEVTAALTAERGIDVSALPLAGHSDLADHMVFVTGRSVLHMRKMADTIARALRRRRLPGLDAHVEARDMDDWMVVDAGNIIVNVMDADARAAFDLENFYKSLKTGQDPYAGMTFDQWLAANPVPDVWLRRLERDEADTAAGARPLPPPASTLVASMGPTFGKTREAASGVRPTRSRGAIGGGRAR